jgi:hypothetical protein
MKREHAAVRLRPMTTRRLMVAVLIVATFFGIVRWLWRLEYVERSGWDYTWEAIRTKTYGEWLMQKVLGGTGFFSP